MTDSARIGVVVIGRNEGERLGRCLQSVMGQASHIVYVDSASTDGSVALAKSLGVEVVSLDLSIPFTAGRARNAGFERLMNLDPDIAYVQFVDGDCEVEQAWLQQAAEYLQQHLKIAVVCGGLRERNPNHSIYNLLCDIEWDTPVGEAPACGGNAMVRTEAFLAVKGFRETLVAGEEPELGVRLREAGWRIWRLEHAMALHDAAMDRFAQWWKRTLRSGHAFAEGAWLHGASAGHWMRETFSALVWGLAIPLLTLLITVLISPWGLMLLLLYPMQVIRLQNSGPRSVEENWYWAFFLVLGKFAEAMGVLLFFWRNLTGSRSKLIEHRAPSGNGD